MHSVQRVYRRSHLVGFEVLNTEGRRVFFSTLHRVSSQRADVLEAEERAAARPANPFGLSAESLAKIEADRAAIGRGDYPSGMPRF